MIFPSVGQLLPRSHVILPLHPFTLNVSSVAAVIDHIRRRMPELVGVNDFVRKLQRLSIAAFCPPVLGHLGLDHILGVRMYEDLSTFMSYSLIKTCLSFSIG